MRCNACNPTSDDDLEREAALRVVDEFWQIVYSME